MKTISTYLPFFGLLFTLGIFSCDLEDPDLGISADQVITLAVPNTSLLADGESFVVVTAELGPESDPNMQITFSTSNGSFLEGTDGEDYAVAASGKTATATLVTSDLIDDNVVIGAAVTSPTDATLIFRATETLTFIPALPDDMILTSSQSSISKSGLDDATLTVELFRTTGSTSQETRVDFEVVELDTATISLAPFAFSNDNGKVTNVVKSANLKPGAVAIIAKALNQNGEMVRDTFELNIIE